MKKTRTGDHVMLGIINTMKTQKNAHRSYHEYLQNQRVEKFPMLKPEHISDD
jgi:hypothetical protein